jgi:AraC-like DNA-binding protein
MVVTVPVSHLRIVLDTAAAQGLSAEELCSAVGLDPASLDDGDARATLDVVAALYETAAKRTADDAFGLHVAERSDFYAFDALGFAIATKRTLRDAFEHLAPSIMALQGTRMDLNVTGDVALVSFDLPEQAAALPCRHRTEAYMARVVRTMALATGARPRLHRVAFRHGRPSRLREHERIFAAPLMFGAARNRLSVDAAVLDAPLVRADPRLSSVLDRHVRDLVARMPAVQTLADQVRRYVRDAFPRGCFDLESIGGRMGVGARTLQRSLHAEGTSHRLIVEDVRREFALHYLVETRMPIKEVAGLLGYAELRAFYRAFERWTGLPPAAYRRAAVRG